LRNRTSSLSALEVLQKDVQTLGLLTVVLDDDTRTSNDLPGVTLSVDLGQTGPLSEDLGVRDLDEIDVVLGTEGLNELEVLGYGIEEAIVSAKDIMQRAVPD